MGPTPEALHWLHRPAASARWRHHGDFLKRGHWEEVVVGAGEVRGGDEGEAADGALGGELAHARSDDIRREGQTVVSA